MVPAKKGGVDREIQETARSEFHTTCGRAGPGHDIGWQNRDRLRGSALTVTIGVDTNCQSMIYLHILVTIEKEKRENQRKIHIPV